VHLSLSLSFNNFTSDLRWDKHVDNICSRANSSLGFIRRNVNIGNPRVKGLAYQSYVRPVLEYSPTVWDPYTAGSIKKIESIIRRVARFTLRRYRRTSSVNAMLTRLNWEPLASRRRAAMLLFYKIHHGMIATPMPLDNRYQVASCTHASRKLSGLPHPTVIVCVTITFILFPIGTVRDWHIFPEAVVRPSSPEVFRSMIRG